MAGDISHATLACALRRGTLPALKELELGESDAASQPARDAVQAALASLAMISLIWLESIHTA